MRFISWLLAIIVIFLAWQALSQPVLAANYGYSRFSNTTSSGDGCTYIVIDKIVNETGALISSASISSSSEIRLYDYSQSGLNPAYDFPLQNVSYGTSYKVTCWPTLGRFDFYVGTTAGQYLSGSASATAGRVNHFIFILTSSFASNGIVGLGTPTGVDRPRYLDLYDVSRGYYYWDPCPAHTKGSYPGYTTKNISWGINTRGFSGSTIQELDDFGAWYYPDPNDPDYSWMKWNGQGNQMGWVMGLGGESHYYPNAPIGMSPSTYYPNQSVYPLPPQKLAVAKDGVYYYDNITYFDSLGNGNTSGRPYGVCYELLTDLRASSAALQSYTSDGSGGVLSGTTVTYGGNIHNYSGTITSRNYTYPLLRIIRSDGAVVDAITPQQGSIGPGGDAGVSHTWTAQPGTYYIQLCADTVGPQYEAQPLGGRCVSSAWFTVTSPPQPTCSSAGPSIVTQQTSGGFNVYAYGVSNATGVSFPTWSSANGQDDLVWYTGTNLGGGTWYATIDMGRHSQNPYPGPTDPNIGDVITHVYVANAYYSWTWCAATTNHIYSPNLKPIWLQTTNSSGTATSSFAAGDQVYVRIGIQNVGGAASTTGGGASYTDLYKDSSDPSPNYAVAQPASIAAGQTLYYCSWITVVTFDPVIGQNCNPAQGGTTKSWTATTGSHQLAMKVNNETPQSSETTLADNTALYTYTVAAPDLQVTSVQTTDQFGSIKTAFAVNEPIYIKTTIANTAGVAATPGVVSQVYRDQPGTVAVGTVSDITPGMSFTSSVAIPASGSVVFGSYPGQAREPDFSRDSFSQGAPGTYTARVYVNFNNGQAESNYANNQATVTYTIANTKTFKVTGAIQGGTVATSDDGRYANVTLSYIDAPPYDSWGSGDTVTTTITSITGPQGYASNFGDPSHVIQLAFNGGAGCVGSSCMYAWNGTAGKTVPLNVSTDVAPPGTYTVTLSSSSAGGSPYPGSDPTTFTVVVAYHSFFQIGTAGGSFAGDIFSHDLFDLDARAGEAASPTMNRLFANGVAGVVVATGAIEDHGWSFSTANNWQASSYTLSSTSALPTSFASLVASLTEQAGGTLPTIAKATFPTSACDATHPVLKVTGTGDLTLTSWAWSAPLSYCKVIIFGDQSQPLNLKVDTNISTGGSPIILVVSGNLSIKSTVTSLDGIYIWRGSFDDLYDVGSVTPPTNALAIHGSLLALGESGNGFNQQVGGSTGLRRDLGSGSDQPAETILFQPKYFDLLRSLFPPVIQSWTE